MLTVYINVGAHANSLFTNEGADTESIPRKKMTVWTSVKANADILYQVQMLTVDINMG